MLIIRMGFPWFSGGNTELGLMGFRASAVAQVRRYRSAYGYGFPPGAPVFVYICFS